MSRSRVRLREALRAPVETTDPAGLAAYAKHLRPVVATLRSLAEDATAPRPMYSREYLREEMLKALRVVEARLDAAAPPPTGEPGDPGPANDDAPPERERDEALASLGAEVIAHRALRAAWTETRAENDRLRAEVERLRVGPPPNDTRAPDDPAGEEP